MPVTISLVVPVYSGKKHLEELSDRIDAIRADWLDRSSLISVLELIFVDDQSSDGSAEVLARLDEQHPWISVITLARNFGQHPATVAGILHTSGSWVVTLDEDLQHRPEDVIALLAAASESSQDVVYAAPVSRVHVGRYRDLLSRAAKKTATLLSGNPHIGKFNSFRLIRGPVARAAASVCGYDTYFDVALSWFTDRIQSIPLELRDKRTHSTKEKSGYNLYKLISHGRRLIMSSGTKAIRVAGLIGIAAVVLSVALLAYILSTEFLVPGSFGVRGWASLFAAISFFGGIVLFQLTIALEYLGILVNYRQGRPTFFAIDRTSDADLKAACNALVPKQHIA